MKHYQKEQLEQILGELALYFAQFYRKRDYWRKYLTDFGY